MKGIFKLQNGKEGVWDNFVFYIYSYSIAWHELFPYKKIAITESLLWIRTQMGFVVSNFVELDLYSD